MNKFDQLIDSVLNESKREKHISQTIAKGWLPKSGGPMVSGKQKHTEQDKRKGRKNWNKGDYE